MSCELIGSVADIVEEDDLGRAYRLFVDRIYKEVETLMQSGEIPSGRKVIARLSANDLYNIFGSDEVLFNDVLLKFLREFNQYFLVKGWHGEFMGGAGHGLELYLAPLFP